jgi:hypothetical protein
MKNSFLTLCCAIIYIVSFSSCEKWKDKPAKDLGLTNKYCNIPSAINYNHGYPGVEDNSICIFPSSPFVGTYKYQDSIYDIGNELFLGSSREFSISTIDSFRFSVNNFCGNANQVRFTANKYYRAASDSIIGAGTQLMCRDLDTMSGTLEYRASDSSLYLEWKIVSDTGVNTYKGRAYKK